MTGDRLGVHGYAAALAGISELDEQDQRLMLVQLCEIRLLPETHECPRVEQDWGRSA